MGRKSYETLYDSYVLSILNYALAVWGFGEQSCTQVLQNRICRYYLGVNCYAPTPAVSIEFDWIDTKYMRWIEMLRYLNRLIKMDDHRWPVKVHKWDVSLKTKGWADNTNHVLEYVNMNTDLVDGP